MPAPKPPPSENGFSLFALAIHRPVAVTMLALGVVVFGAVAYSRLQLALMPRFSHPTLTVRTEYPGSAPEEVEQFVTLPLEKQLSIISGLAEFRSRSRAGISEVMLEFQWGADLGLAALEVREKMDRLFLPDGVESPQLLRFDPDEEPILRLALHGAAPPGQPGAPREIPSAGGALEAVRRFAEDDLKPRLLALVGVAAVTVRGGAPLEVVVEVDEGQLGRHGLSVAQVAERLEAEHVNLAGGVLDEGRLEYRVRTLNELTHLEEIGDVALSAPGEPPLRLRDVARIGFQPGRTEVHARVNGRPAVEVEIFKEADANVVEVAGRVRDFLWKPVERGPARPSRRRGGTQAGGQGAGRGKPVSTAPVKPPEAAETRAGLAAAGIEAVPVFDQSRFIEAALAEVRRTAGLGAVLAVAVLFMFLGQLRSTVLVVVAIPLSILATFLPMFLSATTLNLISLGGLALGIGMLVDNSIVVLEAIHRLREGGLGPVDAALEGVREVGGAVTASTLTTIAVFLPMAFVEGVAGEIIGDLALTVVFSLLASLLVAVLVLPSLNVALETARPGASGGVSHDWPTLRSGAAPRVRALAAGRRWWRETRTLTAGPLLGVTLRFPYRFLRWCLLSAALAVGLAAGSVWWLALSGGRAAGLALAPLGAPIAAGLASFRRLVSVATAGYRRLLARALLRPGWPVALAGLLFAVSLGLAAQLPQSLLPPLHQGVLQSRLELPAGTALEESSARAAVIERDVLAMEGVASTFVRVGESAADPEREPGGEHVGTLWVNLTPEASRREGEADVSRRLRNRLGREPGLAFRIEPPPLFTLKPPLAVEIQGERLPALAAYANQVEARLSGLPQLREVQSLQQAGKPELQIVFNREALSRHGLSAREVAGLIRGKLQGDTPVRFRTAEKRIDLRVRVSRPQLDTIAELAALVVNPGQPTPIPLSAVAVVREGVGPSEIMRVSQRRTALVTAGLEGGDLKGARQAIQRALRQLPPPPGVTTRLAGQGGEMRRSLRSLTFALALAVFLVYLVMASQFESVVEPLVVLFSVPLAGIGVAWALRASGGGLNVLTGLGMIVLVGIVVNNAIILTNTYNRLHRQGWGVSEALLEAGAIRLRPILMTTLTTVLGLLPLALIGGAGAEIRQPIALTLIAGLLASMVLTLVVVPCAYRLLERGD